jgi:hypothetical protein
MNQQTAKVWQQFDELPPEAQQAVIDFIAFLRTRYAPSRLRRAVQQSKLADEPFIGMWRDREDLQDSTAWVRSVREHEWMRPRE